MQSNRFVECSSRAHEVVYMRLVGTLENGVTVREARERRSRAVSQGRAVRDMARGRMPSRWPPREDYVHVHRVALAPDGRVVGECIEDEGGSPARAWVGEQRHHVPARSWEAGLAQLVLDAPEA